MIRANFFCRPIMRILPLIFAAVLSLAICACNSNDKLNNSHSEASVSGGGSSEENLAISMNPQSIAHGRDLYQSSCAACHGASGRGDGPASAALATKPRDHTNG